jgi:hypothetical protein
MRGKEVSRMNKILNAPIFIALICILSVGPCLILAQESKDEPYDPERKLTAQELKEDFKVLWDSLEEGHAGLYRYTPRERFDEQIDAIAKKLNQSLTETEFLKVLLPLVANINDGHTSIRVSDAGGKYFENKPTFFPFNMRFVGQKAYLFRNYSENMDVEMGSELLAINGNPLSDIVMKMLPLISSDAHIETSKFRRLESTIYFGGLYNLLYGASTSYTLHIRHPSAQGTNEIKVSGITVKDANSRFEKRYPEAAKEELPIELGYRDDIAVLTIRTFGGFSYGRAKISYPKFMKKTFEELKEKQIKNLIIDLRDRRNHVPHPLS